MGITRKKAPLVGEYNMEGQPLECVNFYKDLGLFTASGLSWNQHIDRITVKANRVLGLVKRTCRDLNDVETKSTLYCSLVRPLLEYSCETWNPYTKRNIDELEAVRPTGTRWITRSDDDYGTRLSKLKLLLLSDSRFMRDVMFLFNVINGHYDIDISNKLIFCKDRSMAYSLRKNDTQDVPNFSRTSGLKYSFLTVLLVNGIAFLITLENQIVLKLLKRMFVLLRVRIINASIFIFLYSFAMLNFF